MKLQTPIAWALAASLFVACNDKTVVPEAEPEPLPTYSVQEQDFSTARDGLKVGGMLFLPDSLPGRKPAIIFCHGLAGTWRDCEIYGRAAARMGFVSCCFDFCGAREGGSKSDGTAKENTISTEVLDVGAVYETLVMRDDVDPARIILMGGSQGGLVAALYAARNPSGIAAMGLMFPAFNIPNLVRLEVLTAYGGLANIPDYVVYSRFTIWRAYAADAYYLYPYDEIGAYEGPVLILHGDKDELVPPYYSEKAVEIYKNARFILMEGQGHGFDAGGTDEAVEHFKLFLTRHLRAAL